MGVDAGADAQGQGGARACGHMALAVKPWSLPSCCRVGMAILGACRADLCRAVRTSYAKKLINCDV